MLGNNTHGANLCRHSFTPSTCPRTRHLPPHSVRATPFLHLPQHIFNFFPSPMASGNAQIVTIAGARLEPHQTVVDVGELDAAEEAESYVKERTGLN